MVVLDKNHLIKEGDSMWSKKEILIFLAGAAVFHTLSHIFLPMVISLPMQVSFFTFTDQMNIFAIIVSAVIAIGLLWWADKSK